MKTKEYAVWLKPAGNEFEQLITKYSTAFNTPAFDAHITLLSGISENEERIKQKVHQLSKNTQPFNTYIVKVSHSDFYFRSVILELDPVSQLIDLLEEAKKTFDKIEPIPYLPHISIVYSNLSNQKRAQIVQDLKDISGKNVVVKSFVIIEASTEIPIEDWRVVDEIELAKPTN